MSNFLSLRLLLSICNICSCIKDTITRASRNGLYFRYHIRRLAGGTQKEEKLLPPLFTLPAIFNSECSQSAITQLISYLPIRYYILSIGAAAITAIIPLAAGRLGLDPAQGYCWFNRMYSAKNFPFILIFTPLFQAILKKEIACCAYMTIWKYPTLTYSPNLFSYSH